MGIKNLLIFLKPYLKRTFLREIRNKTVGIDGYVWLHKGIFADKLNIVDDEENTGYIDYFMKNINALLKYNVKPVVVFDGRKLVMKSKEECSRKMKREEYKKKALLYKEVDYFKYKKIMINTIEVNHDMTKRVIAELQKKRIEYIIAPHESDAQLSYLDKINYIDYVITEDSDLIAYGCKKILYKYDYINEFCMLINFNDIIKIFNNDYNKLLNFCILAGCDYFKMKGIGIKTAYNYFIKNNYFLSSSYLLNRKFYFSKYTFIHQSVFDPIHKKYTYTNNYKYFDLSPNNNIESVFFNMIENSPITKCKIAGLLDKPY